MAWIHARLIEARVVQDFSCSNGPDPPLPDVSVPFMETSFSEQHAVTRSLYRPKPWPTLSFGAHFIVNRDPAGLASGWTRDYGLKLNPSGALVVVIAT